MQNIELTNESYWTMYEKKIAEIVTMLDSSFRENATYQKSESNKTTESNNTPPILSSTSIPSSSENVETIKNEDLSSILNNIEEIVENSNIQIMNRKKETMKELPKTVEVVSSNHSIFEEMKNIRKHEVHNANRAIQMNHIKSPIINSVTGGSEVPYNVRCDQLDATYPTQPIMRTQTSSSIDMINILQLNSNYSEPTLVNKNTLETNKMEAPTKMHKVHAVDNND